jgi:YidC/Oxa1 family membrane protein insertase
MEKRFFLALLLAAAVVAVTPMLFPVTRQPATSAKAKTDSTAASRLPIAPSVQSAVKETSISPSIAPSAVKASLSTVTAARVDSVSRITGETTVIETRKSLYTFSNIGAAPVAIQLRDYRNLGPVDGLVDFGTSGMPLLRYAVVSGGDTTRLDQTAFHPVREKTISGVEQLTYEAQVESLRVVIRYDVSSDGYVARLVGRIDGTRGNPFLLIGLPTTIRPAETDTITDLRSLSYSFKPQRENAKSIAFSRLDPGSKQLEPGPLVWAAVKNKYFVLGLLNPEGSAFNEIFLEGGPRTSKLATNASATIVKAIPNGTFTVDLYAGPQQSTQLIAMGRDFDHVNPYGWRFLQGVVQPIAALCIRLLLWMHQVLQLSYGWVLVIFGIVVRIILWPLNQSAMRSSLKMQEIQPKLAEVQKKYKDKPEKQREEIMRVYREAGASPFTALSGCLPALIPMPVLFALFFVFQNTIEFRGVPFIWLHDISIKDPLYILPVLMGISMYVLSWIGLRNAPANPQAKMMSYMFPAMMTFFLANMASGLNLYYTAQNIAALPQQWMLARERAKAKSLR